MGHLELDGLRKVYGAGDDAVVAVRGLDVTVDDGEFLVLVGPSGCGKSTTLRCIAGLEQVTGGEIRLDGRTITDEEPKDRDVAMVFQNYALYPHLSVRRNVGFGLKMRTGLSSAEIDERVTETARLLDIEGLLDQKPGQLSGGQQQRVALGRAIVRDPELFLLDEPLSNLDAKLRAQMRTELQSLQHRLDVTTVYVTHDQTEAMTMGDRLAVLNAGELQQIGTPLECYYAPANRFVAGFIGSPGMNFLDVTLADGALRHSAFEYELSADLLDDLRDAGDRLVLGIRPEDVDLSTEPGDDAVAVTAEVVEPMGDVTHVYFDLDGTTYTASVAGGTVLRPGTRVHVSFPEWKLYLFDRETGETVTHRPLPSDPGAVPSPPE